MRMTALGAAALLVSASLVSPTQASAVDQVNTKKLRDAVSVTGILSHQRALQRIANQNGGTRASGTPGYEASADYVVKTLRAAGYSVKKQTFTFPFYRELAPSTLSVTGSGTAYKTGTLGYSGTGDVTGQVVPVKNIQVPPGATPSSSSAGCKAADFAPAPAAPSIALVQRGTCTFEAKADNAVAAGYDAVIIFNEGQPGRDELLTGTLGNIKTVPVIGLSYADGAALYTAAQAGAVQARVTASTEFDAAAKTTNVIADSPAGKTRDEVVVVGAHLDSVVEGPGINDNGSGTATILEIAKQMSKLRYTNNLQRQVRFAFWGAEESGLLGSEYYVNSLTDNQRSKIYANLNFDMLGSPNYARFVYDGNGSDTPASGPPGSAQIEQIFLDYFQSQGLATEPTAFDGRSDYGPFIADGIPAGGLFSGAEGIKTPEQVDLYGGTAGVAYDKCYHKACDTITNLNTKALFELGDAAAHATLVLTRSKSGLYEDGSRMTQSTKRSAKSTAALQKGHAAIR